MRTLSVLDAEVVAAGARCHHDIATWKLWLRTLTPMSDEDRRAYVDAALAGAREAALAWLQDPDIR